MKPEIFRLAVTAMMTGPRFIPCILDRIMVRGFARTLGNPARDDRLQHTRVRCAHFAHLNAAEDPAVFAVLAAAAKFAGAAGLSPVAVRDFASGVRENSSSSRCRRKTVSK
jgi:hypothetical protein